MYTYPVIASECVIQNGFKEIFFKVILNFYIKVLVLAVRIRKKSL